jgi:hypothetical protein
LLITIVVGIGVWILVDYLGRPDIKTPTVAASPSPSRTRVAARSSPTETPEPVETPTPEPTKRKNVRLITNGVSVQVLNGTDSPEAGESMAARLSGLGFAVITVESSSKQYRTTTVYWSFPRAREAAEALAQRFGWIADEKPGNLADTVSLHVVVGRDES